MRYAHRLALLCLSVCLTPCAFADEDADGCKDPPQFTRLPHMHIIDCDQSEFDLRRYPVGKPDPANENRVSGVDVEGSVRRVHYGLDEGATAPSGLQVMRNFQNAAKAAGGTVEGEYPGWCEAGYDDEHLPGVGNTCMSYGTTVKIVKGDQETWTFVNFDQDVNGYYLVTSRRQAMKQGVTVNELVDELNKNGFIALYVNFDTGKATIKPDSAKTLDDAAVALKAAPDLKIEVGGHTDNVGGADANQKLSEERARSVMAALVARGIPAARLSAKGYGQTAPVADNRSEEGRAKNRRVELKKL